MIQIKRIDDVQKTVSDIQNGEWFITIESCSAVYCKTFSGTFLKFVVGKKVPTVIMDLDLGEDTKVFLINA